MKDKKELTNVDFINQLKQEQLLKDGYISQTLQPFKPADSRKNTTAAVEPPSAKRRPSYRPTIEPVRDSEAKASDLGPLKYDAKRNMYHAGPTLDELASTEENNQDSLESPGWK